MQSGNVTRKTVSRSAVSPQKSQPKTERRKSLSPPRDHITRREQLSVAQAVLSMRDSRVVDFCSASVESQRYCQSNPLIQERLRNIEEEVKNDVPYVEDEPELNDVSERAATRLLILADGGFKTFSEESKTFSKLASMNEFVKTRKHEVNKEEVMPQDINSAIITGDPVVDAKTLSRYSPQEVKRVANSNDYVREVSQTKTYKSLSRHSPTLSALDEASRSRHTERSPVRRMSASPERRLSASPVRRMSASPVRKTSERSLSPLRSPSRSPLVLGGSARVASRSPVRVATPAQDVRRTKLSGMASSPVKTRALTRKSPTERDEFLMGDNEDEYVAKLSRKRYL